MDNKELAKDFTKKAFSEYDKLKAAVAEYCRKYQKKNEDEGKGTKLRTFKMVCKRFDLTCEEVEDIISDSDNLDHIVGMRVGGNGIFMYENRYDHEVEWYGD